MDLAIEAEVVEQKKDPCCGGAGYFLARTGLVLVILAIVFGKTLVDEIREANSPAPTALPTQTPTPYPTARCLYAEGIKVTSEPGDYVTLYFLYSPELPCPTDTLFEAFVNAAGRLSKIVKGTVHPSGFDNMQIIITIQDFSEFPYSRPENFTTDVRVLSNYPPQGALLDIDVDYALEIEDNGLLNDIALHELVHALGFGGYGWTSRRDLDDLIVFDEDPYTSLAPYYIGKYANAAYQALGGYDENTTIPIQPYNTSGYVETYDAGTSNALRHWDEQVFGNELMTYDMKPGEAHPLSIITIEALRDLGYVVNPSLADDYTLPVLDN